MLSDNLRSPITKDLISFVILFVRMSQIRLACFKTNINKIDFPQNFQITRIFIIQNILFPELSYIKEDYSEINCKPEFLGPIFTYIANKM